MNTFTSSLERAMKMAQANADYSGEPRYLVMYGGVWWLDKFPSNESIEVRPNEALERRTNAGTTSKGN